MNDRNAGPDQVPAGWYTDVQGQTRHWDGAAWSDTPHDVLSDETPLTTPLARSAPGASTTELPAKSRKGLAVSGLVLGPVSILLFWFPVLGPLIGLVGVLMGIMAVRRRQPRGIAITGLSIAVAATLLGVLGTIAIFTTPEEAQTTAEGAGPKHPQLEERKPTPKPEPTKPASPNKPKEVTKAEKASCTAAAKQAADDLVEMYRTHPYYQSDGPLPGASTEELAWYDEMLSDTNVQWETFIAPMLTSCKGPAELYRALKKYPAAAELTQNAIIEPSIVEGYCQIPVVPNAPACVGYKEWLDSNQE